MTTPNGLGSLAINKPYFRLNAQGAGRGPQSRAPRPLSSMVRAPMGAIRSLAPHGLQMRPPLALPTMAPRLAPIAPLRVA